MHGSFKMFVKLLTYVKCLYILWVSAEMAYNFYNISAGCPMQIDFNLKHWQCNHILSYHNNPNLLQGSLYFNIFTVDT